MLDRPDQAHRRQQYRERQRRHRRREAAGVVMVTIPVDCEIVAWLRRTQWLVGEREGQAEIADALSRLIADAAQ